MWYMVPNGNTFRIFLIEAAITAEIVAAAATAAMAAAAMVAAAATVATAAGTAKGVSVGVVVYLSQQKLPQSPLDGGNTHTIAAPSGFY